MTDYLQSDNFPSNSEDVSELLSATLTQILVQDFKGNMFAMLAQYQRLLADNQQRERWPELHQNLETLFKCGKAVPLDGPMIGIPVSIRDSDYFTEAAQLLGDQRSVIASIEMLGTAWNATFADTGLWMGKCYEPVTKSQVADLCDNDPATLEQYDSKVTRVGRNYFREPPDPDIIQGLGLPALTHFWHLQDRPQSVNQPGFIGELLASNLHKESVIPYSKTGGLFVANMGGSVVPEMNGKSVYQLNYRWENLHPAFPMTKLIDEVVQIADGIYLGQLVYATKHFNFGNIELPHILGEKSIPLGESYKPAKAQSLINRITGRLLGKKTVARVDYGYQNNGYFLLMDPALAKQIYADNAFPQLRPRPGESGWVELGYDKQAKQQTGSIGQKDMDWVEGWKDHVGLQEKFTTFLTEPSPKESDIVDVQTFRQENESVLQMLKRIAQDVTAQTNQQDHLQHFEKYHLLFRRGVAPKVRNGVFHGAGKKGLNTSIDSPSLRDWYGEKETTRGFNYYHGATLNLHWGFNESKKFDDSYLFPSTLASLIQAGSEYQPNILNMVWQSIGKYVFPWAGKSFETISGRKLSMLLDESDDLGVRYPKRVKQLKTYLASWPYFDTVRKNRTHYWPLPGRFNSHLQNGSWDNGMSPADKQYWAAQAKDHWVFGYNLQDKRVQAIDVIMRIADMNYRTPDATIQSIVNNGPSPFVRQGYCFLGVDEQGSNLSMNNGEKHNKKVFQFHYRYPMIGGPVPINYCLDEVVEIADGLFLGQLIYATALDEPFQSSVDPENYKYQLFGYFLLLDDDWERHRQAIGFDVWRKESQQKAGLVSLT